MERRYLVAALAMILAFAATSHGFRALQQMSVVHVRHSGAMAHSMHEPSCAARALAKIRTRLRPRYPEEAQLLAEMNVPLTGLDTMAAQMAGQITQQVTEQVTEQIAQQNSTMAQCARAQAMRDSERARRDAMRMQQNMATIGPMSLEMNLPADLGQRINAELATRMAANNVKLQVFADKLRDSSMRIDNLNLPVIDVTDDGGAPSHVHVHVRCNVNPKTQRQQPQ